MLSMVKYHQIVEQIEDIQAVVLPGISQLNDSVPDKQRADQTQFLQNTIKKRMNVNNILKIGKLCVMRLTQNQKNQ